MPRGGARIGAGRPTGSKARGLRITERMLARAELSDTSNPLQYMLAVMADTNLKHNIRLQAAIAAAPYVHPKLASVEIKGNAEAPLQVTADLSSALSALAELARTSGGPVIDLLPSEVTEIES